MLVCPSLPSILLSTQGRGITARRNEVKHNAPDFSEKGRCVGGEHRGTVQIPQGSRPLGPGSIPGERERKKKTREKAAVSHSQTGRRAAGDLFCSAGRSVQGAREAGEGGPPASR